MGLPSDISERATFKWLPVREFTVKDRSNRPYDWTDSPTTEEIHADVQIPVAVEYVARGSQSRDTAAGRFDPSAATLTILDIHYPQVQGATQVEFDGNTYDIVFWEPPLGLFSVSIYKVHLSARDES
jgi:hypothetical protein